MSSGIIYQYMDAQVERRQKSFQTAAGGSGGKLSLRVVLQNFVVKGEEGGFQPFSREPP
jgi:hypothetical protein